jgi:hypothetical protein
MFKRQNKLRKGKPSLLLLLLFAILFGILLIGFIFLKYSEETMLKSLHNFKPLEKHNENVLLSLTHSPVSSFFKSSPTTITTASELVVDAEKKTTVIEEDRNILSLDKDFKEKRTDYNTFNDILLNDPLSRYAVGFPAKPLTPQEVYVVTNKTNKKVNNLYIIFLKKKN